MFFPIPEALTGAAAILAAAAVALWLWEHRRMRTLARENSALAESAAELEENAAQAIITADGVGLIRGFNPAAQALFGYNPEELYGQSIFRLLALSQSVQEDVRRPGRGSVELPAEARHKDGTPLPVLLRITALKTGLGPRVRFFIEDLSLRHRHAQLEMENSLLWPTFDEAGLVIVMVNPQGAIIRLSAAGLRLLKLAEAEVEARLYWEVFERPESWEHARAAFEQAKGKLGPTRLKADWIALDGSPIALDWLMLSPSWDEHGELAQVVVTAALATGASAARLQNVKTIERVAGRIAGHFENLLSTINGYSELVLHDLKPLSPLRRDVEQILAASERASETVRQLLNFSGCRLTLPERVELSALLGKDSGMAVLGNRQALEEMLAVIREYAPESEFTAETVRPAKAEAMIGEELPPGDYVKLSASLPNAREEEASQHLIEPFGSPQRGTRHSTVGLAMVHGIARSCGGGVSLKRTGNAGVTLEIWLPAAEVPQTGQTAIEPAKEAVAEREIQ